MLFCEPLDYASRLLDSTGKMYQGHLHRFSLKTTTSHDFHGLHQSEFLPCNIRRAQFLQPTYEQFYDQQNKMENGVNAHSIELTDTFRMKDKERT